MYGSPKTQLHIFFFILVPAPPQNVTGTIASSTVIMFSWNPPPAPDQNGVIIFYSLNITLLATGEVLQYTSPTTSITISGLKPFSTYSYIIAASTSVGLGPVSPVFNITTPEDGEHTNITIKL